MSKFIHLHNHSHYSLLDAISTVYGLVDEAVKNKMPALALTDHGVMYGAMEFYKYAVDRKIKPIKEVSTLVNEQLAPGTYEADWNASNYPSGVYFYKLTAGDFVETKKMLLIK